jgi:hypothetical protein
VLALCCNDVLASCYDGMPASCCDDVPSSCCDDVPASFCDDVLPASFCDASLVLKTLSLVLMLMMLHPKFYDVIAIDDSPLCYDIASFYVVSTLCGY